MKKSFISLITFGAFVCLQAGTPAYSVVDGNYEGWLDTAITSFSGDTVTTSKDSLKIITGRQLGGYNNSWEYILGHSAMVASGDSVGIGIYVRAKDGNDSLIKAALVDSFKTEAAEYKTLSILGTVFGVKYDIWLQGLASNGKTNVVDNFYLFKRRVVVKNLPAGR